LEDLAEHRLLEIEHFFVVYKNLEDKAVEVEGWGGLEAAHEAITRYTVPTA
jgi:inorganic pyrophosphatase